MFLYVSRRSGFTNASIFIIQHVSDFRSIMCFVKRCTSITDKNTACGMSNVSGMRQVKRVGSCKGTGPEMKDALSPLSHNTNKDV